MQTVVNCFVSAILLCLFLFQLYVTFRGLKFYNRALDWFDKQEQEELPEQSIVLESEDLKNG